MRNRLKRTLPVTLVGIVLSGTGVVAVSSHRASADERKVMAKLAAPIVAAQKRSPASTAPAIEVEEKSEPLELEPEIFSSPIVAPDVKTETLKEEIRARYGSLSVANPQIVVARSTGALWFKPKGAAIWSLRLNLTAGAVDTAGGSPPPGARVEIVSWRELVDQVATELVARGEPWAEAAFDGIAAVAADSGRAPGAVNP